MFTSEPAQAFVRSLNFLSAHKTLSSEDKYIKKDGITPNYESIVKTDLQNFPSTNQTKKMMFALFANEGLLMKDGFQSSGEINLEGCQLRLILLITIGVNYT